MVNFLTNFYKQDKSSLIKYSLKELYEDWIDKQMINEFETNTSIIDQRKITVYYKMIMNIIDYLYSNKTRQQIMEIISENIINIWKIDTQKNIK